MRRAAARTAAALAAALVVLALAGPAAAGEVWYRIPCASGGIDDAVVSGDGQRLTLAWHLDCAARPEESPARFGHGLYPRKAEAVAPGQGMRIYSPTAPTLFSDTAALPPVEDLGICVVTDYEVRIACVRVVRGAPGEVVLTALPTGDPLVDRPVRYVPKESGGGGTCGGCW
ncbi:hypothetical protein [Phytohabitans suffuscus]|uniref:Lipoprotein n=1 Tax=Phytohabitans suffuscus TaxID=624315 RepID=A0A6F8YXL0_9ACTN|nr:hypothetical protein [Phytohabitans suffuscus]BCB90796.1 hypothetical protein Psuf_081090 [Phytohabitans suffuscus]